MSDAGAPMALTQAQHGIWVGQEMDPGSPAYMTAEAIDLQGPLDVALLQEVVRDVLLAADGLHMRFVPVDEGVLQLPRPDRDCPVPLVDLSTAPDPRSEAAAWVDTQLSRPVDLAVGPLFSTAVLRLSDSHHRWFLAAHHIALDGFGHVLLCSAVATCYSERLGGVCAVPQEGMVPSMRQAVEEDQKYRQSAHFSRDREFWRSLSAEAPTPVCLAANAPVARTVLRCRGEVGPTRLARWQLAADAAGVDLSTWMLAAVAAWLQARSGATRLVLGLPVMNRLGSVTLRLPCMAMNILPLPLAIDAAAGMPALIGQVAVRLRAQRAHQRYRYEDLRRDLGRVGGGQRLFGPVVNLMPFERPLRFAGLLAQSLPVASGPVEDLSITVAPRGAHWQFDLEANPNAYSRSVADGLHTDLLQTIDALADADDRSLASVLPRRAADIHLLEGGPLTAPPVPVLSAFAAQARAHGARNALEHEGRAMSYAGLLRVVQHMAGQLAAAGVGPDRRVAVLLPRSMQTITALLSVLWVGGAYVPVDPEGPVARLAMVLDSAVPALVITERRYASQLPAGVKCLFLDDELGAAPPRLEPLDVDADAPAYVIYTSGSTGRPNGVVVARGALAHFIAGAVQRYGMTAADRMLQFAPLHFDASIEEIFLPLTTGATLVLRTDSMLESVQGFLSACGAARISVLDLPTAFWHELAYSVGEPDTRLPAGIRLVIIGGEAALAERVQRWKNKVAPHVVLLNTYGPTEATVICTTACLAGPGALRWDGDSVPIGLPLAGVDIVVVDDELRPLPKGAIGELCVMGGALARGYLGRPELTAQRFVQLSVKGARRAYRTGDQVRVDEGGQLHYLGRLDDEVKLSGHRVDLSEVETTLLACANVRETAVLLRAGAGGGKQLVAFVVGTDTSAPTLRAALTERLPIVAVPSAYVFLERLPRNLNNKIDRPLLRTWPLAAGAGVATGATELERQVMAVWCDVLGVPVVSPGADFFELGGKSLQAIQAANRLGLKLQREVPVSTLFRHPTVAALAQALSLTVGHAPPPDAAGHELAPLLPIHRGPGPALFCLPPAEGLSWCYFGLSRLLPDNALFGLQARGLTGALPASFEEMVVDAVRLIREARPHGPYRLLGWSSGGGLAHAVAQRLQAQGESIGLLAIMDGYPSDIWEGRAPAQPIDALLAVLDVIGASPLDGAGQPLSYDGMRALLRRPGSSLAAWDDTFLDRMIDTALHTMRIYRGAQHRRFDGDLLFFRASVRAPDAPDWRAWAPHVTGRIEVIEVDSTHSGLSQPRPLAHIGRVLAQRFSDTDT